jgi:hypothetical protein
LWFLVDWLLDDFSKIEFLLEWMLCRSSKEPKRLSKTSRSYACQPLQIWRLLFIFFYFTLLYFDFLFFFVLLITNRKCCKHLLTCGRLLKYIELSSLFSYYELIS